MQKMQLIFTLCLVLFCQLFVKAAEIKFGELPMGNYSEVSELPKGSLSSLYGMSAGFVNLVWKPFTEFEDLLSKLLTADDINEVYAKIQDNLNELLSFETGYLVCLAFGIIFIVLVVFGGLITCCCRTCCGKCGGTYKQSSSRIRSTWRHIHVISLSVLTILITLPCIFIFLTNNWLTTVIEKAPNGWNNSMDNLGTYVKLIPEQLGHMTGEFTRVNESIISSLNDIENTVGVPLQEDFKTMANPALKQLDTVDQLITTTVQELNKIETSVSKVDSDLNELKLQLEYTQKDMKTNLGAEGACTSDAGCNQLLTDLDDLKLDSDFSSVDTSDASKAEESLNNINMTEMVNKVNTKLDEIPSYVADVSQDAVKEVVKTMDEANTQLDQISNFVDNATIGNVLRSVERLKEMSTEVDDYSENYDKYRIIACYVLGAMILVICVLYFLGIILGQLSYNPDPEGRDFVSKLGGVLLMAGVGLSFIFAWLLMLLIIVLFTVGGHGERYMCQPLEQPFDGWKFVDSMIASNETNLLSGAKIELDGQSYSIYEILNSCEKNNSIYETLKLENVVNLTEQTDAVMKQLDDFKTSLKDLTVDLSGLEVYNSEIESDLDAIKDNGMDDIDLRSMVTAINNGLNAVNIDKFVNDINTLAARFRAASPPAEPLAAMLDGYADNLTSINNNHIQPLRDEATSLDNSVTTINDIVNNIDETVDDTKTALSNLDSEIKANGTELITKNMMILGDDIADTVSNYLDWAVKEVEEKIGACRPLYDVYGEILTVLCSYMVDVLGGLWFSLGWSVFFLAPASIVAIKLAKFYRGGLLKESEDQEYMDDMEMNEYTSLPQQKSLATVRYR